MLQERVVDTGSVNLNFAQGQPSGPPLVLLHGIPGRWQEFLPVLPALSMRWQVYALDLRGQGKSGRVSGQYHARVYAQDVISFLKKEVSQPALIFGMSAGGMAGIEVAASSPDLVKALVLGDSPIDLEWLLAWMTSEGFMALFSAFRELANSEFPLPELVSELGEVPVLIPGETEPVKYGDQPGVDEIALRQLAMTLHQMDPDVLEYHAEGRGREYLQSFDLEKIYARITCPVMLLQANPELGGMMTDASVEYALSRLENGVHVLLEECGHDLGLDSWKPGSLLRALFTFLESVDFY
jgi:pimeloyl-ACP methyl ester carboxylesterase